MALVTFGFDESRVGAEKDRSVSGYVSFLESSQESERLTGNASCTDRKIVAYIVVASAIVLVEIDVYACLCVLFYNVINRFECVWPNEC